MQAIENLAHFVDHLVAASEVEFEEFGLVAPAKPESSLHSEIVAAGFSSELIDKLYRWFDGQNGVVNLFGDFQLLSFEESMVQWDDNHSNFGNDKSESCSSRIQPGYGWRKLWFPFAWDSIRNRLLILDFDPSPKGDHGQVFLYDCRQTPGDYLANSFESFLDWYWNRLNESGFERGDFDQFVSVSPPE